MKLPRKLSAMLRLIAVPLLALSIGMAGVTADAAPERAKASQSGGKAQSQGKAKSGTSKTSVSSKKGAAKKATTRKGTSKKSTARKGKAVSKPAKKEPPLWLLPEPELIAAHRFPPEQVGYVLVDVGSGAVLASHEPHRPFLPASVAKVPTAVAALNLLGPDHRFVTSLYMTGTVAGGALAGDLYLRGGGDPYLFSEDLRGLIAALQARGVSRVTGRFFHDASTLPAFDQIDPVQPDAAQYNPGLSALSINFNRIAFAWTHEGGLDGLSALALSEGRETSIPLTGVRFGAAPQGARADVPLVRAAGQSGEFWMVASTIAKSGRTWLPLRRPAAAAAQIFRAMAQEAGIAMPAPQPGIVPPQAELVGTHESDPLAEVTRKMLKYSNNLAAELVGLTAAQRLAAELMSLRQASDAVADWYRRQLPHVDWEGFRIENFSGLSSASRMSPAQIAGMLTLAAGQRYGEETLFSLLPGKPWEVEADEGNGKKGETGDAPEIAIRAKTGTVAYGRGLAGYIDRGTRRLGFVIFISDLEERGRFDASEQVRSLILPPEAKNWLRRARSLERSLVLKWAASGGPPLPPP